MTQIDPGAHGILANARRGHEIEPEAHSRQEREDRNAVEMFLIRAASDMLVRMRDGLRRGWGSGWRSGYSDKDVSQRVHMAAVHLGAALQNYRTGDVSIDELRKRAADVSNQAFMLADPERLRDAAP